MLGRSSRTGAGGKRLPPSARAEALQGLEARDAASLRADWQRLLYGTPAPAGFSRDLLMRGLAYHLQEQALGGLSPAIQRRLASIGRAEASDRPPAALRLKPGAMLVREWRGRTHTVQVLSDGGFEHAGRRYASLSQVACAITGAHWSGPRLFGLRRTGAARANRG